jgi:hypothetical protein
MNESSGDRSGSGEIIIVRRIVVIMIIVETIIFSDNVIVIVIVIIRRIIKVIMSWLMKLESMIWWQIDMMRIIDINMRMEHNLRNVIE